MEGRPAIHIVMFSAESVPFVKVGGLADVVGTLPRTLEKLGAQVSLVLPEPPTGGQGSRHLPYAPIPSFELSLGAKSARAEIRSAKLPSTQVEVFMIGGGGYFPRPSLYDDPVTREGYADNLRRFVFFAKAGIELLRRMGKPVDVIHCHDSQMALVPALLRTVFQHDPFFARTACMFTIHNLAYQGFYSKEDLFGAGIESRFFYPFSPFEFWGGVNLMKAGIETSDLLTTVSETYAREIQSDPEYGCGLEGILQRRAGELHGILNGIDYDEWDPATDPLIPAHFSIDDLSGKAECKARLLEKMGLPHPAGRVPLIGIVSRLADQKGFDLIGASIDEIAARQLQLVVLGTGQAKYHEQLARAAAAHPGKIAVRFAFDNALAHQIEAGCDMFLMPSRYEPCGLNQLYSMRYGAVPIVRATGGLADTVIPYDALAESGTGFSFKEYNAARMMDALDRSLVLYQDPQSWQRLVMRGMKQRWTWQESALKYFALYEKLARARPRSQHP
jgi:starch synthase